MNVKIDNQISRIRRIFDLMEEGSKRARSYGEKTGVNVFWGNELKKRINGLKQDVEGLANTGEIKGGERDIAIKFYDTCAEFCENGLRLKGLFKKYYAFDSDMLKECAENLNKLHKNYRLCNF